MQLLELGVSLDALRAGGEELPLEFWSNPCPVGNALAAVRHIMERGEPFSRYGKIVMALFIRSCHYSYKENDVAAAHKDFGEICYPALQCTSSGGCPRPPGQCLKSSP